MNRTHPPTSFANYQLNIPSRTELRSEPLRGRRVLLSPIEPADGPELFEAVETSREHLARWLPWVPFNTSEETSQRYVDACTADWDAGRALRFGIRSMWSDEFLGVVGLDNCVHLHKNCDLGYWLRTTAVGRGLMSEAAELCIRFAFERAGLFRIRCAAATHNDKSLAVIARLGFKNEGTARSAELLNGRWVDHEVFARLAIDEPL